MKLSVIVVNYRGWKRLRLCLESLRCLKDASFSWEVIIVDNASADGQLPLFVNDFPEFLFLENKGNFGFANGCNLGAKHTKGEYVLFLNPDTTIVLEALQKLLTIAEEHPEFTIVSCSQVTDTGKDTRPYGLFLSPEKLTSFMRSIYKLTHKAFATTSLKSGAHVIFPDWVSGSFVLISRAEFNRLGGWSEDFWMYYEDADLCKRVWEKGGSVALINTIKITHNHGGASRINTDVTALTKSEVIISKHVYIHKHFHGPSRPLMQLYLVLNNVFLQQLILALLGIIFFFIPSLRVYAKLYAKLTAYYVGVVSHGTWISPRSVNYKKSEAGNFSNSNGKAG